MRWSTKQAKQVNGSRSYTKSKGKSLLTPLLVKKSRGTGCACNQASSCVPLQNQVSAKQCNILRSRQLYN